MLASPFRARLGDQIVIAADQDLVMAELAQEIGGLVVGTRRPVASLAPVAIREVQLTDADHVPIPVWLEPGYALPAGPGPLLVTAGRGIHASGYVPEAVRGVVWEPARPAPPGAFRYRIPLPLHAAPAATAPVVAELDADVAFDARASADWLETTVVSDGVRAHGWIDRASLPAHVYDFSDDVIESDDPKPGPEPSVDRCVHRAPSTDSEVIGLVVGPISATPVATGWRRVAVHAAWGDVTGYLAD